MCLCACDCHKSESRNDWTHWRSSLLTTLSHCRRVVYCCRFVLQSVPKLVQHRARFQLKSFVARSVCNIRACFGLLNPSNLLRRQPSTAHLIRTNNWRTLHYRFWYIHLRTHGLKEGWRTQTFCLPASRLKDIIWFKFISPLSQL